MAVIGVRYLYAAKLDHAETCVADGNAHAPFPGTNWGHLTIINPIPLEGKRIGTAATDQDIPSMDVGLAWRKGGELPQSAVKIADYFRASFLSPGAV